MNGLTASRRVPLVVASVLLLAGCESEPPEEMVRELDTVRTEREELRQRLVDLEEKAEDLEALQAELRTLELPEDLVAEGEEAPPATARDSLLAMVRAAGLQMEEGRDRWQRAQAQAAALGGRVDSLHAELERTTVELQGRLAEERNRVSDLQAEVTALEARGESLEAELTDLTARLEGTEAAANRVYYVAGTREELLERGVVTREGGARVVLGLFWKRGEALVPARDLDPAAFTAHDRRELREIPLPQAEVGYRIVSHQQGAYLEPSPDPEGRVRGDRVTITDPEAFWTPSRFLILVEEG